MKPLNVPATRAEFERNFHILSEMFRQEKISFSPHLKRSIRSLMRVRVLPNGRIDFLSVDESARLNANMMAEMVAENLEPPLPEPSAEEP